VDVAAEAAVACSGVAAGAVVVAAGTADVEVAGGVPRSPVTTV
jgi:hypothetical protein